VSENWWISYATGDETSTNGEQGDCSAVVFLFSEAKFELAGANPNRWRRSMHWKVAAGSVLFGVVTAAVAALSVGARIRSVVLDASPFRTHYLFAFS
jgi:hypothetical protein